MSQIVDELRRMVAVEKDQYAIAGITYWDDKHLEGVLAKHVSQRLLQVPVEKTRTLSEANVWEVRSGAVAVAGTLDTETAQIFDSGGAPVDGATIHPDGRIDFDVDRSTYFLVLSGLAYDLHAAAAEVLTDWAAAVKGGYDVTVDGQSLKRSQRYRQLLDQARDHRSRALVRSVSLRRGDTRPRRRFPGWRR